MSHSLWKTSREKWPLSGNVNRDQHIIFEVGIYTKSVHASPVSVKIHASTKKTAVQAPCLCEALDIYGRIENYQDAIILLCFDLKAVKQKY